MKERHSILQRMADIMNQNGEPVPGQPLIEIAGEGRVLIENHSGVKEYLPEKIRVTTKYGCVVVCGCGLKLTHMSREQLVITGRIHSVSLHRRNG